MTCIDNSEALIITYLCYYLWWVNIYKLIYWFCTNLFLSICLRVLVNYFSDTALLVYYSWCVACDVGKLDCIIHSILFYLNFLFLASVLTCFSSIVCNCYSIVCLHNLHSQIEFELISVYFKFVYTKAYMQWEDRVHIITE